MRVFVIGGTGFIGYHAVQELLRRGHAVCVLSRQPDKARQLFGSRVTAVAGDLDALAAADWARLLAGCDALVFAAGVDERTAPVGDPWAFFHRANVQATTAVLQGAETAGVARAVVIGSIFAWLHRQRPELQLATVHPYIGSRVAQEAAVLATCRHTLPVILELPYVFGAVPPGQRSLWEPIITYVRTPVMLLSTAGGANMVSVQCVAHAIAGAVERSGVRGTHAVGDENLSWADLLRRLCVLVGRHEQHVTDIPVPVLCDLTRLGGFFKKLFGIQSGLETAGLARLLTQAAWFDPQPAQQALGYGGGDLDAALAATVAACPETRPALQWRKFWDWVATGER